MRNALAASTLLILSACAGSSATPSSPPDPSASSACRTSVAAAAEAGEAGATEAALEAAISVCADAVAWQAATTEFEGAFEEVDPQQFLTDRCINGPPDLADTSLCETVNAER